MSAPLPISPRTWSYALLERCEILVSVDEQDREDPSQIGALWLESYSPEHGEGYVMMSGPAKQAIARWLYGVLAISPRYLDARPAQARKVERVFESFIEADRLQRRWLEAALRPSATSERRIAAMRERKQLANALECHRRRLRFALRLGLERRVGSLLEGEENTWLAFAARRYKAPGLRVCEQCSIVFRADRAKRCSACRRSPVVPKLHPVATGGWHLDFRIGGRWSSGEFERVVTYIAICRECDRRFDTAHPSRRLCRNCGSASGRVRRHRGSRLTTGRAAFAYVSVSREPLLSVGVTGPRGQAIVLHAENGIVRVTDREYARQLDATHSLRRMEPLADI